MGKDSKISWTHHTFNPWWGCTRVSPGCLHCYAEAFSKRTGHKLWGTLAERRVFQPKHWSDPVTWDAVAKLKGERHRVFCASMADVFEDHPTCASERPRLWELISKTSNLDWLLLTKRPENINRMLPDGWANRFGNNLWLGTSVENEDYLWRVDELRKLPAVVRFISYEPALGPLQALDLFGMDWLIYGGESGSLRRADKDEWARIALDKCRKARTAFWFKQTSALKPGTRPTLDGIEYHELPTFSRRSAEASDGLPSRTI